MKHPYQEYSEDLNNLKSSKTKKKVVQSTVPIRVKKTTLRSIRQILNRLNKKAHGRKIITDDVVSKALGLLQDEHFEEIKKMTYSSQDHLDLQYQEYCRLNGQVSKGKFLEMLLQAGLPALVKPNRDKSGSSHL